MTEALRGIMMARSKAHRRPGPVFQIF